MFVVLFSTLVFGGLSQPALGWLGLNHVQEQPQPPQPTLQDLDRSHAASVPFLRQASQTKNASSFTRWFRHLDDNYLKQFFGGKRPKAAELDRLHENDEEPDQLAPLDPEPLVSSTPSVSVATSAVSLPLAVVDHLGKTPDLSTPSVNTVPTSLTTTVPIESSPSKSDSAGVAVNPKVEAPLASPVVDLLTESTPASVANTSAAEQAAFVGPPSVGSPTTLLHQL